MVRSVKGLAEVYKNSSSHLTLINVTSFFVSAKDNAANSVECCFLKPHWYGLKMLCSRK